MLLGDTVNNYDKKKPSRKLWDCGYFEEFVMLGSRQ